MIAAAGCSQEAAPVAVQQHPQAPDHEQEQLTAKSTFNMTLRFRITAQRERGEAVDRPELVSPRTRRAFREHLVAWPLRAIEDLFENEGLQPQAGFAGGDRPTMQSRGAPLRGSGLELPHNVRRVLRAYEHLLADPELPEPAYGQLTRHLQWDGCTLTPRDGCTAHRPQPWTSFRRPASTTRRPSTSTSTASGESWTPTPPRRPAAPEP